MKEIDAMYQACEEMCQRCPCFVVCRDDDTKLCDRYLMRVDELEAADVVKVVRCKDCDLWNEWDKAGHELTGNLVCSCAYFSNEDGYIVYTGPDDYCSNGERKEV